MKKTVWVIGGCMALLVGTALICPALAELRMHGALPTVGVGLLLLGVSLTYAGGKLTFSGLKSFRR